MSWTSKTSKALWNTPVSSAFCGPPLTQEMEGLGKEALLDHLGKKTKVYIVINILNRTLLPQLSSVHEKNVKSSIYISISYSPHGLRAELTIIKSFFSSRFINHVNADVSL